MSLTALYILGIIGYILLVVGIAKNEIKIAKQQTHIKELYNVFQQFIDAFNNMDAEVDKHNETLQDIIKFIDDITEDDEDE